MITNDDYQLFDDFVQTLKDNGFKVFTSSTEQPTWAHYVKDNKIGYMQLDYFGGLTFSTVHKPCAKFGTGFRLDERGKYNPTLKDAEQGFIIAPQWARGNLSDIKKYDSWNNYLSYPTNQILKYREL